MFPWKECWGKACRLCTIISAAEWVTQFSRNWERISEGPNQWDLRAVFSLALGCLEVRIKFLLSGWWSIRNCAGTPERQQTNKRIAAQSVCIYRGQSSLLPSVPPLPSPNPQWNVGLVLLGAFLGLELSGVVFYGNIARLTDFAIKSFVPCPVFSSFL